MSSVLVLTEGGPSVGLGHVRRCLTLAGAVKRLGIEATFAVSGGSAVEELIESAGFAASAVNDLADAEEVAGAVERSGAAAIVIDSYRVDEPVFRTCKAAVTVAIDDVADRPLPVDIVVNSAPGAQRLPYRDLTDALLLLGSDYALLRPEFAARAHRTIRASIERVLVTLGGGDHRVLSSEVAQWCLAARSTAEIEIVAGPFWPGKEPIVSDRMTVLDDPDMREAMLRADLAVSAGGQTLFELAATGLPAVVIETASNQRRNIADFAAAGTVIGTGTASNAELRVAFDSALSALASAEVREAMSTRGPALVDGRGAERTAAAIAKLMESRSAIA
jgi:UDP-2,4-diacetamido-2,4,6-trideoxy-beta-L-altropyranose hydrolase